MNPAVEVAMNPSAAPDISAEILFLTKALRKVAKATESEVAKAIKICLERL